MLLTGLTGWTGWGYEEIPVHPLGDQAIIVKWLSHNPVNPVHPVKTPFLEQFK